MHKALAHDVQSRLWKGDGVQQLAGERNSVSQARGARAWPVRLLPRGVADLNQRPAAEGTRSSGGPVVD